MALGNAECLQTLAKQTNVKVNMLQCCSDIIKLWVTKIKGELIKQRSVAKQVDFNDLSLPRNEGRFWKESIWNFLAVR